MALTQHELDVAVTVRRVLSLISSITCFFIVVAIILFQKYRLLNSRLVLWLSISSALQTFAYFFNSEYNRSVCVFQAIYISFFDWAIASWICVIAFNLHQVVVIGRRNVYKFERYYHIAVWGSSTFTALLPLLDGTHVYGDSGAWCWIVQSETAWRVAVWYGPLLIFFVYVGAMYVWIIKTLYSLRSSEFYKREEADEERNKYNTSIRLSKYALIFIVLWIMPIANRVQNWIAGDDGEFALVLLHTISISIQGTINSIVYTIDEGILYNCTAPGLKNAFIYFLERRRRPPPQLHKYELRNDSETTELSREEALKEQDDESLDNVPLDD